MGTVFLIDGPAETGPPVSIMHPDISVKWHPVCNRRIIVLALQHRVALLIGQFIGASRGAPALRLISGYKIRFNQQLPILIIEQMLGSEIHFYVSVPVIRAVVAGRFLGVDRLPLLTFTGSDYFQQSLRFRLLINQPAVMTFCDRHSGSIGSFQFLRTVCSIVFFRQIHHIRFHSAPVNDCASFSSHRQPRKNRTSVQYLRTASEPIGHGHICTDL